MFVSIAILVLERWAMTLLKGVVPLICCTMVLLWPLTYCQAVCVYVNRNAIWARHVHPIIRPSVHLSFSHATLFNFQSFWIKSRKMIPQDLGLGTVQFWFYRNYPFPTWLQPHWFYQFCTHGFDSCLYFPIFFIFFSPHSLSGARFQKRMMRTNLLMYATTYFPS